MNKIKNPFSFYSILTNPVLGYVPLAKILIDQKIPFLQLRIKNDTKEHIKEIAIEIARICLGTDTKFIINDDPQLVLECGADGVHLGQDDMPYQEARRILGGEKIIGLSTHNPSQVRAANKLNPDYIGMGPVYTTPTKQILDPVLGVSGLREMLALTTLPAVAIGGIDFTNIHDVKSAGAQNICAVRLINEAKEPIKILDKLKTICPW